MQMIHAYDNQRGKTRNKQGRSQTYYHVWTTLAYLSEIFPAPLLNVDPHYSGMDAMIECNIETGVRISVLRQDRVGD